MKQKSFSQNIFRSIVIFAAATAASLIFLSLTAYYNNKYILKAALTQEHFLEIPSNGCYALTDGWELYPDRLLTSEDFSLRSYTAYNVCAGVYPNLSMFHENGNPYGTATWRLILTGNGVVTLYLPEPLCASKVYVDGQYLGQTGEVSPDSYKPLIRDSFYSFPIEEKTELIIQTANYSHYYGGIWYIPVIGDSDSISHMLAARILLYALLFSVSLTLALFCIVFWARQKPDSDSVSFYFGMLSLSFALRICYPFLRMYGVPSVRLLYALEDAAALSGIYFSLQIVFQAFLQYSLERMKFVLRVISLTALCMGVLIPVFILPAFPGLTPFYGQFVSWYKVSMAGVCISLSAYACFSGSSHIGAVLSASAANGVFLLYGVLSFGQYEPLVGAYPEEYGAFCMVAAFAVLMVRRSHAMAMENKKLNLHLQEEVQEKTQHLQKLITERSQLISELGHDMKSPLTSLSNIAQIIRLNDIMLDEDTRRRMLQIEKQCEVLSERLKSIQEIATQSCVPIQTEKTELHTFLSDFCHSCRPVIELNGTTFTQKLNPKSCHVMANPEQLFRALENLVYNAADFTPPDGEITLSLDKDDSSAYIIISDTGCGIPENELPYIFHRAYTTRAEKGGQGLGLAITHAIISEHGGQIEVNSKEGEGTTFTVTLPLIG